MNDPKIQPGIQVIDRAAQLLDAIGRYSKAVTLKTLSAETRLAPSTAYRILQSLISNRFVERDSIGNYRLGQRLLQLSSRAHSDIDLRAVSYPYMQQLCDRLGETINLTIREGDVVIYFEKVTPKRMMHVNQVIGSRAPLHVTAVGKLMLGRAGKGEIADYARRTNLPAYTRNTLSSLDKLESACMASLQEGYAMDDEEAEIGVGCIGVLLLEKSGNVSAGLSVSAPIERRRDEWIEDLINAGREISQQLGYELV